MDKALRELLPPKIAEIGAVIGLDAALKLAECWPGVRLYVPKRMSAGHPIAVAIGYKPACALASVYGSDSVTPPMCSRYFRERVKQEMLKEYRAGASASELARKYGVHQFSIYNLAAADARSRQQSLL